LSWVNIDKLKLIDIKLQEENLMKLWKNNSLTILALLVISCSLSFGSCAETARYNGAELTRVVAAWIFLFSTHCAHPDA